MYEKITYYSRMSQTLHVPVPAVAPAGYQGPGDIVGSATAFWGLRSYSDAILQANTNIVDFYGDGSGALHQDFAGTVATNGFVDASAIATWLATVTSTVARLRTMYEQRTSGIDFFHSNNEAASPTFTDGGVTTGVPSIDYAVANSTIISTILNFTAMSQPLTICLVVKKDTSEVQEVAFQQPNAGASVGVGYRNSAANQVYMYAGNVAPTATCSDNAFHSIIAVFDGPDSVLAVDGSGSTGDCGSNSFVNTLGINMGCYTSGINQLDGSICEVGIWPIAFSPAQIADMYANHSTYYGGVF